MPKLCAIRQQLTELAAEDPGVLVKSEDKNLALKYAVRRNDTFLTVLNYVEARNEYVPQRGWRGEFNPPRATQEGSKGCLRPS